MLESPHLVCFMTHGLPLIRVGPAVRALHALHDEDHVSVDESVCVSHLSESTVDQPANLMYHGDDVDAPKAFTRAVSHRSMSVHLDRLHLSCTTRFFCCVTTRGCVRRYVLSIAHATPFRIYAYSYSDPITR